MSMRSINEAEKRDLSLLIVQKTKPNVVFCVLFLGDKNTQFSYIQGSISVFLDEEKNTWEVCTVSAKDKFGPLMYDIVSTVLYPSFICSDRGEVSGSALNIWKKMSCLEDKYEKTPCEKRYTKNLQDKEISCVLNQKYRIREPLDLTRLTQNYRCFLKTTNKKQEEFEKFLLKKAGTFFIRSFWK